jgi:hypothetical protein
MWSHGSGPGPSRGLASARSPDRDGGAGHDGVEVGISLAGRQLVEQSCEHPRVNLLKLPELLQRLQLGYVAWRTSTWSLPPPKGSVTTFSPPTLAREPEVPRTVVPSREMA